MRMVTMMLARALNADQSRNPYVWDDRPVVTVLIDAGSPAVAI
jgi:hypothetical protein